MKTKNLRKCDDWRKAASELKSRLDTDFRNHVMLSRSLEAHRPQYGPRLAEHYQPGPARLHPETPMESHDMERSSEAYESISGWPKAVPPPGPNDVAVLGTPDSSARTALHSEGQTDNRPCGPVNATNVLRLLEHQDYRCALTGRRLTPDVASLDHIVPVRDGGEHRIENTQALHKDVNRAKSTMSLKEFVQLCREVVRHAADE